MSAAVSPTSGGGRPGVYKLADGTRVPSVTTITGRFKESGALIHWAWNLGMQQIDYKKARDDAADAGHIAHELIDAHIHGREANINGADPKAVELGEHLLAVLHHLAG